MPKRRMTIEEARAIMTLLKQSYINLRTNSDLRKKIVKENIQAYDMAIKALEQEPMTAKCKNCKYFDYDSVAKVDGIPPVTTELCGDCVNRQAVLEYIEGSEAELGHSSENELVCQYIKELPPVKAESKWIPVSERMPKKYTYTLWCASSGYVRSDYFNGEFWEDAKKYCYEVIAWMPLPKPYQPQERSDKE